MSYHIYQTKGFVVGSSSFGEADKIVTIFTENLGLVRAQAKGVRRLASKLRFNLQNFSLSSVALVRGKREWKITNSILIENIAHKFADNADKLRFVANLFSLVKKMTGYDEENAELYVLIEESVAFAGEENLNKEELFLLECISVLRVLHILGYLEKKEKYERFLKPEFKLKKSELLAFREIKREGLQSIKKAIEASQLH